MNNLKIDNSRAMTKIEYIGITLVILSLLGLILISDTLAGMFDSMAKNAYSIFKIFIIGNWNDGVWSPSIAGVAIIVSVIIGRTLERAGFTDALVRIFVPITKIFNINPSVIIPAVYNILGDINAAGRIAGPSLMKAGCTKAEQKIAVATMVQSQQSFSTFMLGILSLSLVGDIKVFPVVFLAVFLPLIIVPPILKYTIYRETKAVQLNELPYFTPKTPLLTTIFGAAREGAELLFLLIIPAAVVIFALIGGLDYLGLWAPVENALSAILTKLSIDPATGIISILVSPAAAMGILSSTLTADPTAVAPNLVIGSFVLACSGFPLSVIFGQIPAVWAECTDLTEKEAMSAAVIGAIMKLITAAVVGGLLYTFLS